MNDLMHKFRALAIVADGDDPRVRFRWIAMLTIATAADVLILYASVSALEVTGVGLSSMRAMAMFVLGMAIWYVCNTWMADWSNRAFPEGARTLTDSIIERLCRLPLSTFESIGRGILLTRLTSDANRVASASRAAIGLPRSLLRTCLGFSVALMVSVQAATVAVLAMVITAMIVNRQTQLMSRGHREMATEEVQCYELLRSQVEGLPAIKTNRTRARGIRQAFERITARLHGIRSSVYTSYFDSNHLVQVVLYATLGLNVFVLPQVAAVGMADIREINLFLVWVVGSVIGTAIHLPEALRAADALERLHALRARMADDVLEPRTSTGQVDAARFAGFRALTVEGLTFRYPQRGGRPGFRVGPVAASFQPGEVVFITGDNGSGKSTFLHMLTGLYRAEAGCIRVDDTVVKPADLAEYRSLFACVFTDHYLFPQVFGIDERGSASAELLAEMELAHKTSIRDGAIGNRDLSTGQKKRLAMVLARLSERPILLFDEWAADQDPEFRALYYQHILHALRERGKLVLVVTHDDQYFHLADRTLRFDAGEMTVVDHRASGGAP